MRDLLDSINGVISKGSELPFSVYTSVHEQTLLNVPIAKPLLIVVISGDKKLGKDSEFICHSGEFVFLSDSPAIDMRNIPKGNSYFALLIEFDYEDFNGIPGSARDKSEYFIGDTKPELEKCLQQFIECSSWASEKIISARKNEILLLLHDLGYKNVVSMAGNRQISYKLHKLFHKRQFQDVTTSYCCEHLAMSESTLRRKLKAEGTSLRDIKSRARLGLGLHLLQTTSESISLVSEKCGYQSQSRFTEQFKRHFGLTPSELRKTKVTD
jgi:AraC-like DNA-binding protein